MSPPSKPFQCLGVHRSRDLGDPTATHWPRMSVGSSQKLLAKTWQKPAQTCAGAEGQKPRMQHRHQTSHPGDSRNAKAWVNTNCAVFHMGNKLTAEGYLHTWRYHILTHPTWRSAEVCRSDKATACIPRLLPLSSQPRFLVIKNKKSTHLPPKHF